VGYGDVFGALLVLVSIGIGLMAFLVVYRLFRGQS
jgi:multisubunit Na+/H+ antiporter MnhB subunit